MDTYWFRHGFLPRMDWLRRQNRARARVQRRDSGRRLHSGAACRWGSLLPDLRREKRRASNGYGLRATTPNQGYTTILQLHTLEEHDTIRATRTFFVERR
jgi:hypothetical protein